MPTLDALEDGLRTTSQIMIGVLFLTAAPCAGYSADIQLAARYGGTQFTSEAAVVSPDQEGYVGGTLFVALDVTGPAVVWTLQPLLSYEYQWDGDDETSYIKTHSDIFTIGASRVFEVGYAHASLKGGAAYFGDTYDVKIEEEPRIKHVANGWGVSIGMDLQFKFLDHLDAVVGYKYLGRTKPIFDDTTPGGIPYRVEGRRAEHCISAGVVVKIGGI